MSIVESEIPDIIKLFIVVSKCVSNKRNPLWLKGHATVTFTVIHASKGLGSLLT